MNAISIRIALRTGVLLCTSVLMSSSLFGQSAKSVITLDPQPARTAASAPLLKGEASFANPPANFHSFPASRVGQDTYPEKLTLRFSESTKISRIQSTQDFQIESSSSCAEGRYYSAGESCLLLVHFTPQGAGRRFGRITISHTASAETFNVGLGGNGYAPVISFTPAIISTVNGTNPSGAGLLSSAMNLTVDGGDTLYIADSANKVIRFMDSSGAIKTLTTTATNPNGIAVDNFGEVYFDEPSANTMHEIYDYGPVVQVNGSGTASCPASTPCNLNSEALGQPGTMSIDAYNHLFFVDSHQGAALATVQPLPAKLIFLYDPFPFQTNPSSPLASDASDNVYSLWSNGGTCSIIRQTLFDMENSNVIFTKIAGGHTCGFSGDGGQGANAEIGAKVGQMDFDAAGNFYFSDTNNQRVRRIDATTGIISTIAGTGTAGYTNDGGQATSAQLSSPTGVTVDSQGQVYIISSGTTGQVIRKLGPNGFLQFGTQKNATTSSAHLVTVANTGNSAMTLTKEVITGTNAGDFSIDPNTTSCLLTPGSVLYSGQSCKIGVLFKPGTTGARSANLVLLDNTVTNSNTVQLSGTGSLTGATISIISPAASASPISLGANAKFSARVTSSLGTPTGTVKFAVDGKQVGSLVTLSSGTATVTVKETIAGTHTLSATYSGDKTHAAAGPVKRTFTVAK